MEQLTNEAHDCVDNYVDERGVIGKPSDEVRTACWSPVNDRLESIERRESKAKYGKCPSGMVSVCNWVGCSCVRQSQIPGIFRSRL